MIQKYLPAFLKAILAGVMIAVGGMAYLSIENHYVGTALFTIGLFTIYTLDLYLFTGKIGYLLEDKDLLKIVVIWIGNFVGTFSMAKIVMATRMVKTTPIIEHAVHYAHIKLTDGMLSIFLLGAFCGLMMFIGAQSYKLTHDTPNSVGGYIGLFLCVMIFLLLGFEHSIANMFYFTLADAWSVSTIVPLLVVTLGNAVGGLFFNVVLLPIKNHTH